MISKMMPKIKLPAAKGLESAADDIGLKTGSAGGYMT